jgi:tetratricopeptide (TPR) repeat protein
MKANDSYKNIIDRSWQLRKDKRLAEAELLLHENIEQHAAGSFAYRILKANLADVQLQRGDQEAARETALQVLAEDPNQATALTVLGLIALDRKSYHEAVENLKKAYDLFPSGYRAGRLARAYELNGEADKAAAVLQDALLKDPRDGYLFRQRNNILKKISKTSGSADHAEIATSIPVTGVGGDDCFPYAEQMRNRLQNLAPATALGELQKVLKVGERKKNPFLQLLLGDLQRDAGDDEAAVEAYRQAQLLDPQNQLALSQYVFALRRLGRREEAWPLLKELLLRRPLDVTAKSSLLKDAGELNREEEAVIFFEELLDKYPERKEFFGAIRKLRSLAATKGGR